MHLQTFKITSLFHAEKKIRILARSVKRLDGLNFGEIRFVSPAKFSVRIQTGFGLGLGQKLTKMAALIRPEKYFLS